MGPVRGTVLLALLGCLLCMTKSSVSFQCEAPDWDDSIGTNPFIARRGKVVLVALLKGYCGYCVHQAGRLYQLKNELISEGYPDVDMIIVNGGEPMSRNLVNNLIQASPLEVIQDTLDHDLYRRVFRANKDDFLVYDRCNQAAVYIPSPYSDLDSSITKQVLKAVHVGRHDCYCSLDYAPRDLDDMMQGDDPGVSFYQTHDMSNRLVHCNPRDSLCQMFQGASAMQNTRRGLGSGRSVIRSSMRRRSRGRNFLCRICRRARGGRDYPTTLCRQCRRDEWHRLRSPSERPSRRDRAPSSV